MATIEGQVIIDLASGAIRLRTSSGTFEQGSPTIAAIAQMMKDQGVQFTTDVVPEQHRHDDPHAHEHAHTHAKA